MSWGAGVSVHIHSRHCYSVTPGPAQTKRDWRYRPILESLRLVRMVACRLPNDVDRQRWLFNNEEWRCVTQNEFPFYLTRVTYYLDRSGLLSD